MGDLLYEACQGDICTNPERGAQQGRNVKQGQDPDIVLLFPGVGSFAGSGKLHLVEGIVGSWRVEVLHDTDSTKRRANLNHHRYSIPARESEWPM